MKVSHCLLGFSFALALTATDAGASIKVYDDRDYKGAFIEIHSAVPDLRELDFDDRITSLQADETWLVCSAPRFKGDCREVEGGLVNLRLEGMNNRITSIRPAKKKGEKHRKGSGEGEKGGKDEKKEKADKGGPVVLPAAAPPVEWWGGSVR